MCDVLVINTKDDPFLNQCAMMFPKSFRGCTQSKNFIDAAEEIYDIKPPKVVLIDADNIDYRQALSFVGRYIGYKIALTEHFYDKKLVKSLYVMGFSDVRPKDHYKSLVISLGTIIKKRENTIVQKIRFSKIDLVKYV